MDCDLKLHIDFYSTALLGYSFIDMQFEIEEERANKINQSNFRSEVIQYIKKFFGKDELNFVAVDGSNDKHQSAEFLSFYGGAYGARGTLKLSENPPVIEYKRWEIERDVTMVAFVPIPYSQLGQIIDQNAEESFSITDKDAIDITHLDGPMMQLAEIFLAYNSATSSLTKVRF